MNNLFALCLLLALPTLVAADVEGMVLIDDAFYIDMYEYPNQRGTLPKVDVTWGEAESLCAEQGKRLCTEQEWQKACTGPQNFAYSYGDRIRVGALQYALCRRWGLAARAGPSTQRRVCRLHQ